jgi:hypothetical protein
MLHVCKYVIDSYKNQDFLEFKIWFWKFENKWLYVARPLFENKGLKERLEWRASTATAAASLGYLTPQV